MSGFEKERKDKATMQLQDSLLHGLFPPVGYLVWASVAY